MAGPGFFFPPLAFLGARGVAAGARKALAWRPLADDAEISDATPAERQLAALAALLEEHGPRRPRPGFGFGPPPLDMVVSDRHARWLLLPWQAEVADADEKLSLARHRFREIYGEAARHWRVAQADVAPGIDTPCCAMDQDLARRLEELAAARGYRLASLRPLFAAAAERWRARLPRGLAWFGVVADGHLSLGLRRDRRWLALHAQPLDQADDGDSLAGIMTRRALAVGLAPDAAPLFLCGAGSARLATPAPFPGLAVTHLGAALPGLEEARP